jgi:hypothetical protein
VFVLRSSNKLKPKHKKAMALDSLKELLSIPFLPPRKLTGMFQ